MANKSERLLNLLVLLQHSQHWVTRAQLRSVVPEYANAPSDESFERMFERDKSELRDIGVPIETGPDDAVGDELGYRVRSTDYQLPTFELDADDLTILALAARAWQQASLEQDARTAAMKVGANVAAGADSVPELDIRLPESGPWFGTAFEAITQRRAISFAYRRAGSATTEQREVEPWQLFARRGAWYVIGHDRLREAPRAFRTSRIHGDVSLVGAVNSYEIPPRDVVADHTARLAEPEARDMATVAVHAGRGVTLRRIATSEQVGAGPDGTDVLTVPLGSEASLAASIVALGGAAIALEPPTLVAAVQDWASAVIATQSGGAA